MYTEAMATGKTVVNHWKPTHYKVILHLYSNTIGLNTHRHMQQLQ